MQTITFKNVSFAYAGSERQVLRDLSFGVEPGEFVLLCGKSGCGKSTLLRQLKAELAPYGKLAGEVLYRGRPVGELTSRFSASQVGFVQQSPDNQIVTDKVWRELAFGLESLGLPNAVIRRRVAEMASFFNMQTWFRRDTAALSGGQKQLLNLAAVMVMNPGLLVLDEPTAQLDPIAASDFIAMLSKINRELGVTVIISEHRLEELFLLADKVLFMDGGQLINFDTPQRCGEFLCRHREYGMYWGLPAIMRVYAGLEQAGELPLTVRDSRIWLASRLGEPPHDERAGAEPGNLAPEKRPGLLAGLKKGGSGKNAAIHIDDLWFQYNSKADWVVRGLKLDVAPGELYCILGGNGVGKSTSLKLICGALKKQRGKCELMQPFAMLPQNPQALFTEITVREELAEALVYAGLSEAEVAERAAAMQAEMELAGLEELHPYDLSGGEQQRLALGKILLLEPKVLLLDEPTKGLDPFFKRKLGGILKRLKGQGIGILMVTHDIEFCAEYADRCGLFFDGELISSGGVREFFAGNRFYTTAANRMAREWFPQAITCEEVVSQCAELMTTSS